MSEQPKYQPYTQANEEGSNSLKQNPGQGSTEPYRPNGWENGIDKSSEREGK
jgi:hypothetical protein